MLQFIEALNPYHSCFTVADFDDALIDIQLILKKLESSSANESHALLSSDDQIDLLEKAFHFAAICLKATNKQKPDRQLTFLLADILRQYATLCYQENYFSAKQILVIALNLHLYTIDIFNECLDLRDVTSLDDLKKQCAANLNFFHTMEQSILSTSMERCLTLAYTHNFMQSSPQKKLFSLAETARWLGHCYQNISLTALSNPENELRFSQLFGLSEALHLLNDDEAGKHALANLYLKAWPFMLQQKNPPDVLEIFHFYDTALAYDSSREMQARVDYGRFFTLFSNGHASEALPFLQKAITLTEDLEVTDRQKFFLSTLYDSFAGYWMNPETLDLEQAKIYLEKAESYASQCRAMGKDRLEFALYDLRLAEFKFILGEFEAAGEIAERSIITLQKYPQSQQPHLIKAEALKSLIAKALKMG